MITKRCSTCKEFLPATPEHFHRDGKRKDGLVTRCKICTKKYQQDNHPKMVEAAYRWKDANPDEAKAAMKNWRAANPEKLKQHRKLYYVKNKDEINRKRKEWEDNNREKVRAKNARWKKENPAKNVILVQRRRTRKIENGGDYTAEEWQALCKQYDYLCLCCKEPKPLTVDHVVPISKGGKNTIDNIQPLCNECNSRKGQNIIDYR